MSRIMRIPGEDLNGVFGGIDFLKKVNYNENVNLGKKVAVIGGGNTAIDCARTARRFGSDVTLIYRRTRREMPAESHEIKAAVEEGVNFKFLTNPVENIGKNGKLTSTKFAVMELGEKDSSGRRRPQPTGEEFTEEFDNMLVAVSQNSDLRLLEKSGVETTNWNTIVADATTFQTNIKDIFTGGDVVLGPASVVEAVGQAAEAAISINRYILGEDLAAGRKEFEPLPAREYQTYVPHEDRVAMRNQTPENRIANFEEMELGFSEEEAQREANRCLECGICSGCLQCEIVCEAGAIVHNMKGEVVEIDVGSVIIATGADTFDPTSMHEYGFGRYKNVVTSIQYERILAASGPFEGHLQRPSDGVTPVKVAWIQCVGSRTEHTNMPYCSSVCCMYAMKEAIISKEHVSTVEPTIFFMDIRAHGKDFDKYYDKAKDIGVTFKRGRIGKIKEIAGTKNLQLYYVQENGDLQIEEFDMVVLSVGLHPPKDIVKLSDSLGVRLNEYNFIDHLGISQIDTTRPGVFVCGPAVSPKDIPETVVQASGAVAGAAELLSEVRGTEITEKVYPEEKKVEGQKPRIGVFVCHCGINIGSVVDVPGAVEFAKKLPNVVYAGDNLFTCSQDTQIKMKGIIEEYKLNRVVVASCSPSTHEALFQETMREAGLNPYLFEMANIRNQCSWVHRDDHAKASEKANRLIKIALGKSRLLQPLHAISLDVVQKGIVIGGGLAGMTAALSIANQGFEVTLIERAERLGGNLNGLYHTLDGQSVPAFLQELKDEIDDHPLVKVYLNANVKNIDGYIGNYKTTFDYRGDEKEYNHGIIIITIGANASTPKEYLYNKCKNVITQRELEHNLEENEKDYKKVKSVAFIQCVGSRDEE
ncbi:MAG: FAD-dependent oxidoreductase, partial [Candidatus Cloacimonetes bacterium]|nr:FAD-dependent oxidoreductase [Candidatus Cloacimonadota bacterium]